MKLNKLVESIILQQIHIPPENSEAEFGFVIIALAKAFVSHIGEGDFKGFKEKGSLGKPDSFLYSKGLDINLRSLWDI